MWSQRFCHFFTIGPVERLFTTLMGLLKPLENSSQATHCPVIKLEVSRPLALVGAVLISGHCGSLLS